MNRLSSVTGRLIRLFAEGKLDYDELEFLASDLVERDRTGVSGDGSFPGELADRWDTFRESDDLGTEKELLDLDGMVGVLLGSRSFEHLGAPGLRSFLIGLAHNASETVAQREQRVKADRKFQRRYRKNHWLLRRYGSRLFVERASERAVRLEFWGSGWQERVPSPVEWESDESRLSGRVPLKGDGTPCGKCVRRGTYCCYKHSVQFKPLRRSVAYADWIARLRFYPRLTASALVHRMVTACAHCGAWMRDDTVCVSRRSPNRSGVGGASLAYPLGVICQWCWGRQFYDCDKWHRQTGGGVPVPGEWIAMCTLKRNLDGRRPPVAA